MDKDKQTFEQFLQACIDQLGSVTVIPMIDPVTSKMTFTAYSDKDAELVFDGEVSGKHVRSI